MARSAPTGSPAVAIRPSAASASPRARPCPSRPAWRASASIPERARSSCARPDVDERHVVAGHGRHLGDPRPHLARRRPRRSASLTAGSTSSTVASPWAAPEQIAATPMPAAAAAQLVHERPEQARARRADRVPERDRAAVHVDALRVDPEQLDRVQRDRAEGLVHLEQVDVGDGQARLLERHPRRRRRRPHQVGVVVGHVPVADGSRRAARGRARAPSPRTRARAPPRRRSRPGRCPAVVAPSFENTGGSAASRSAEVSRRGPSSVSTTVSPLRPGMVTGTISSASRPASMAATARSWLRSAQASCCSRVMPISADTCEFCSAMIRPSNVQVRPSEVIESTSAPSPKRVAEAGLRQQVGRVRHALHAAGHDHLVLAGPDHDVGQRGRAHARGAHLVDRLGARPSARGRSRPTPGATGSGPTPACSTSPITT